MNGTMHQEMGRVYLDNAATSWPKPEAVYQAVDRTLRHLGAPYGRGSYLEARQVQQLVEQTRENLARMIGASDRRLISFCFSCTDALNMAIQGILTEGGTVVTSVTEHNSILRVLDDYERHQGVSVTRIGCDAAGFIDIPQTLAAIQPSTQLVVLSHAGNVTGAIQDLAPVGELCQKMGVPFLVDGAQSMGQVSVDVNVLKCDMLAASGHKGLLGPLGTGFLYTSSVLAERLKPLRFGGTGASVGGTRQPDSIPEKFEAGNLNVPGIAGLLAGIQFLEGNEGKEAKENYRGLLLRMLAGLKSIPQLKVYGAGELTTRTGVFAVSAHPLISATDLASVLDSTFHIQTRAGFHCAPSIHDALGTADTGGLLRISPGYFNRGQDLEQLLAAFQAIFKHL